MKKKRQEHKIRNFIGKLLPYVAVFLVIFGVAKIGAETKNDPSADNINMNTIAAGDYNVSADQLSTLYVVANLSGSFDLASTDSVAGNYVTASVMKGISQTSTDKIEKPNWINTNISRGVVVHEVKPGETMESIARKYGLTTDQIRWSNGLKTTAINPGDSLKIPSVAGIVYTAKAGDTPESLAARYGSSAERIIAANDLEGVGITEGAQIVLPGGTLPNTERPEYVAPARTYTYYGSTSERQNMHRVYDNVTRSASNRMVGGQCTYYAWWWREAHGNPLPSALTGDAKYWANNARRLGLTVNNSPSIGAVFQTTAGWYGHVGVVVRKNPDGSIVVREMNYGYRAGVIMESTIPANVVGNFNYIH